MKLFYDEVRNKRKGKRIRLQVDIEFQQVKIKDLNNQKMWKCSQLLLEAVRHLQSSKESQNEKKEW